MFKTLILIAGLIVNLTGYNMRASDKEAPNYNDTALGLIHVDGRLRFVQACKRMSPEAKVGRAIFNISDTELHKQHQELLAEKTRLLEQILNFDMTPERKAGWRKVLEGHLAVMQNESDHK